MKDSMKKLQGDCVSWLVLLTGAAQLLLVCGEGLQLLSVLPFSQLQMDSSPTLPTTHLTMIWALWPLMPVTLGLFWTSP